MYRYVTVKNILKNIKMQVKYMAEKKWQLKQQLLMYCFRDMFKIPFNG